MTSTTETPMKKPPEKLSSELAYLTRALNTQTIGRVRN